MNIARALLLAVGVAVPTGDPQGSPQGLASTLKAVMSLPGARVSDQLMVSEGFPTRRFSCASQKPKAHVTTSHALTDVLLVLDTDHSEAEDEGFFGFLFKGDDDRVDEYRVSSVTFQLEILAPGTALQEPEAAPENAEIQESEVNRLPGGDDVEEVLQDLAAGMAEGGDDAPRRLDEADMPSILAFNDALTLIGEKEDFTDIDLTPGEWKTLPMLYQCKTKSDVQIRMLIAVEFATPLCVTWVKSCGATWGDFAVVDESLDEVLFHKDTIRREYLEPSFMRDESSTRLKLELHGEGSLRVRNIEVASRDPMLSAYLRGRFYYEKEPVVIDSANPAVVDVIYNCSYLGENKSDTADVRVTIHNDSPAVPPIVLKWTVLCRRPVTSSLILQAASCSTLPTDRMNKTVIMEGGVIDQRWVPGGSHVTEIAAADDCTAFTLMLPSDMDAESLHELKPRTTMTYDKRQLFIRERSSNLLYGDDFVTLQIPYICFDNGLNEVRMTLHLKGSPSIDLGWLKHCSKPEIRQGRALTTGGASAILVCTVMVVSYCCCCTKAGACIRTMLSRIGSRIFGRRPKTISVADEESVQLRSAEPT